MARYARTEIMYPTNYANAVDATIKSRARAKRQRGWLEEVPAREQLIQMLQDEARGGFLAKMLESYNEWGSLTEGQEAAVVKALAEKAGRRDEKIAADSASEYVGEIGKRMEFGAQVEFITGFEGEFGYVTVTIFRDMEGNILVHKGSGHDLEKGDMVTAKGTVKKHEERKGVKQTILSRVKILGRVEAETAR